VARRNILSARVYTTGLEADGWAGGDPGGSPTDRADTWRLNLSGGGVAWKRLGFALDVSLKLSQFIESMDDKVALDRRSALTLALYDEDFVEIEYAGQLTADGQFWDRGANGSSVYMIAPPTEWPVIPGTAVVVDPGSIDGGLHVWRWTFTHGAASETQAYGTRGTVSIDPTPGPTFGDPVAFNMGFTFPASGSLATGSNLYRTKAGARVLSVTAPVGVDTTIVTRTAHGYSTGNDIFINGSAQKWVGEWTITVVDPVTFTLDGSAATAAGESETPDTVYTTKLEFFLVDNFAVDDAAPYGYTDTKSDAALGAVHSAFYTTPWQPKDESFTDGAVLTNDVVKTSFVFESDIILTGSGAEPATYATPSKAFNIADAVTGDVSGGVVVGITALAGEGWVTFQDTSGTPTNNGIVYFTDAALEGVWLWRMANSAPGIGEATAISVASNGRVCIGHARTNDYTTQSVSL
jgi:hypothetical protein